MVRMNRLSTERRAEIIGALVEGNSLRSTVRMTGAAMNTVLKLLLDLGEACSEYQDGVMQGLPCKRVQCDEIWSFVGAKARRVRQERAAEWGDYWTWVAIDADTKLVPSWYVGKRTTTDAMFFMQDLASRLTNRVQLTTDGWRPYLMAVDHTFGDGIDYATLHKIYGHDPAQPERRYSPGRVLGTERQLISGDPDPNHVSTSYIERQNLTMRMGMRRFTRLTNGFSKKAENHVHAISLHFMHYNFARPHKTLGTTPAVAAGVADHVWTLREIAGLLD
jgi:IS1 family transposase